MTYKQMLILIAIKTLKDDSRLCNVARLVMTTTNGHKCMGTSIYAMSYALLAKGYIEAWVGPDSPRCFYTVTPKGAAALAAQIRETERMVSQMRRAMRATLGDRAYHTQGAYLGN